MALPNPGMDALPLTTLPAEFLDDIIENIESLSAGTGYATNAIPASALSKTAIALGYAQATSNFTTTSSSPVLITGLTSTVTIPSGGRKVRITAYLGSAYQATANTNTVISIYDGAVGSGTVLATSVFTSATANAQSPMTVIAIVTPAAGSKTYNVSIANQGGSSVTAVASATQPAFLFIETL